MIKTVSRLIAVSVAAAAIAVPSFADGRKGRPNFVAPPVPALRTPAPASLPPAAPLPPPIEVTRAPDGIVLPANFGTGGVGYDIGGGGGGGSRIFIVNGGASRATSSATAVAFAFASAGAFAGAGAGGHAGNGHAGGHGGNRGGCSGCK